MSDVEDILKRWGAAVRARREELQMSQVGLATAAGCSQRLVSAIELGETQTELSKRLAIAKALQTSHETLFAIPEEAAS